MRIGFVFTMICAIFSGCAKAQAPVEIVDGRHGEPWHDLSAWVVRPPLQQASEAARAYWIGRDSNYEEEVRVLAIADGAFTHPEAEQQAVLFVMSLWPRCCPKMGLALVEGDRLVRNVAFESIAQTLSVVPDLDGDGRDELFYTGTFGMGGQESRTLTFLQWGEDGLVERGSTPVYESTCASGRGDSGSTAARVFALPGPAFMIERYTQKTCEEEAWELVSGPEPLEFTSSSNAPYVDLSIQ